MTPKAANTFLTAMRPDPRPMLGLKGGGEVLCFRFKSTKAEIAYLADETPGDGELYAPVPSIANLSDDEPLLSRSVNLKDFAVLIDSWLDELLWPQP